MCGCTTCGTRVMLHVDDRVQGVQVFILVHVNARPGCLRACFLTLTNVQCESLQRWLVRAVMLAERAAVRVNDSVPRI